MVEDDEDDDEEDFARVESSDQRTLEEGMDPCEQVARSSGGPIGLVGSAGVPQVSAPVGLAT